MLELSIVTSQTVSAVGRYCLYPDAAMHVRAVFSHRHGECFDEQVQQKVLDSLKPEYIEGMTLLGGEPFEEENQEALLPFMKKVKSLYPDKNVWAFTGYIYDKDLILGGRKHTKDTDDLLSLIDVLVDGPFIEEQKDITLKFRGSVNQRILDLKKTMESGKIVKLME